MAKGFIDAKLVGDVELDLSKFEQVIKDKVLFSGAATMASVLANEARHLAPTSTEEHYFYGSSFRKTGQKYLFQPGNLKRSIYWAHAAKQSTDDRKTYRISWNRTKAPYGYMVEFGTSRASAHPFLRPAFGRVNEAIAQGQARMAQRLKEVT
jgi:HK97 gp10 family phage protein